MKFATSENLKRIKKVDAPCADGCNSFGWFCGQFIPMTSGCTQVNTPNNFANDRRKFYFHSVQYFLRRKVLRYDMTKYICCQGYFNRCCCTAGEMGEKSCPDLCLCIEAHCCNCLAVSYSRLYVMDKYALSTDPCDYRVIRINNCIQILACVCDILAMFFDALRPLSACIDHLADCVYHSVSGCMTSQVSLQKINGTLSCMVLIMLLLLLFNHILSVCQSINRLLSKKIISRRKNWRRAWAAATTPTRFPSLLQLQWAIQWNPTSSRPRPGSQLAIALSSLSQFFYHGSLKDL